MLSNPLHRFSPYHTIPTTTLLSNGHVPTGHMHASGMDALAQGSHYALQQLQQHVGVHNPHNPHNNPHLARPGHGQQVKHRQNPYGPARGGSAAGPIRRRISRACDQCNQLRTKCDGQHPCAHCIEFGLGCEYIRERKKRGKASRKDLAQQAAAQAAAAAQGKDCDEQGDSKSTNNANHSSAASNDGQQSANDKLMSDLAEDAMQRSQRTGSMDSLSDMAGDMHHHHMDQQQQQHHQQQHPHHLDGSAGGLDLNGYGAAAAAMHNPYERQQQQQQHQQAQAAAAAAAAAAAMGAGHHGPHTPYAQSQATMSSYPELPYAALQTQSPTGYSTNASSFRMGTSPLSAYPMGGDAGSPPWMTMSSPPPPQHQQYHSQQQQAQAQAQQQQQHQAQQHQQAQQQHQQQQHNVAAHMHSLHNMHNMHAMHPALAGAAGVSMGGLGGLAPGMASSMPLAGHHPHHDPLSQNQHHNQHQHQHQHQQHHHMPSSYNPAQLRYPVLEPLVPHLAGIVPLTLACDLIDLYFASSSSAQMHPMSPYVLGFVFRKRSFLHPTKPRACQPALLASMLWVAAQTSDASFLTSVPSARGKICQKLLELTVGLLKPLIHTPANTGVEGDGNGEDMNEDGVNNTDNVDDSMQPTGLDNPVFDGVALGGLGVAMPGSISMEAALAHAAVDTINANNNTTSGNGNANGNGNSSGGAFGAAGTIDDVVTYIHLATVVSASEYKGASLRWWNAAWSLARELKLGRELPLNATSAQSQMQDQDQGQQQGQQTQTQTRQETRDMDAEGDDEDEDGLMGMGSGIDGMDGMDGIDADLDGGVAGMVSVVPAATSTIPVHIISDEEREERRRIWWLVYIVDRHLALCYNRPLFLLDIECDGLLRPMDDTDWQNGEFKTVAGIDGKDDTNENTDPILSNVDNDEDVKPDMADDKNEKSFFTKGRRGPTFECTGHSIYGYFLPLMTILGEIVDLHHARNHPRFGLGFRTSQEWDAQISEITRHLAIYEQSLKAFEHRTLSPAALVASNEEKAAAAIAAADASNAAADANTKNSQNNNGSINVNVHAEATARAASAPQDAGTPSVHSVHSVHSTHSLQTPLPTTTSAAPSAPLPRMTELDIQTRIVAAYGTHVMHVLHILLAGKWDPVNLLDDNDLWISSQGFITATGHAVSAAEAISSILEYDPGLEFMPFFFGIYLLQGSFLLLLIADKLQLEASTSVVRACETIIRAHEACVVTLNTEYQRNFSRVMRSALAQVRGRVPEDLGEQHMRRRELLALYRWTGDGTGLAL